jgi:hypothetical protein
MHPIQQLTRPIVASDWDRVLKYSHRVKHLTSPGTSHDLPRPNLHAIFEALRQGVPGGYFLPNLLHLVWNHSAETTAQWIDLFLGPRITSVSIYNCPSDGTLSTFARRAPALTGLSIGPGPLDSPDLTYDERCKLVRALTHIEWLEVGTLDREAFMHLGQLESLDTLHACLPPSVFFPETFEPTLYYNLRVVKLELEQTPLRPLVKFVQTWDNPGLESFEAEFYLCPLPDGVEELYHTLIAHSSHEFLHTLKVQCYCTTDDPAIFVQPGDSLRPLFCFANLEFVSIHTPAGSDLDDATIADMARSWPYLTELHLRPGNQHRPPRGTLVGLQTLAQHCPFLRALSITLDATAIPVGAIAGQRSVESLHMGSSPITTAAPVARWLSSVFRGLTDVRADYVQMFPDYYDRWEELRTMLPGLSEVRDGEVAGQDQVS